MLANKGPISTQRLLEWIPHRPPMVWVDEVLSYGPEGGQCLVRLNPEAHYFTDYSAKDGTGRRLRPSSLIEFLAQSQGFIGICQGLSSGADFEKLQKAFLVSISKVDFFDHPIFQTVDCRQNLVVKIEGTRSLGPIVLFTGSVWTEGVLHEGAGEGSFCLMRGHLKAFTAAAAR